MSKFTPRWMWEEWSACLSPLLSHLGLVGEFIHKFAYSTFYKYVELKEECLKSYIPNIAEIMMDGKVPKSEKDGIFGGDVSLIMKYCQKYYTKANPNRTGQAQKIIRNLGQKILKDPIIKLMIRHSRMNFTRGPARIGKWYNIPHQSP